MMATTPQRAWDWKVNTKDGVDWFTGEKTAIARGRINKIIKAHSGLRQLTPVEMEKEVLLTYGPGASNDLSKQYFIPVSDGHGGWEWAENPTESNPVGIDYVDDTLDNDCKN